MRPLVKTLATIGIACAIADRAVGMTDDADAKNEFARLNDESINAMRAFPGLLNEKEIRLTARNISAFCDKMNWDNRPLHTQTLMNFSSELLENIRSELVAHNADKRRIEAIDTLIEIEAGIYGRFAQREYPLCAMAGQRASEVWDAIWNQ